MNKDYGWVQDRDWTQQDNKLAWLEGWGIFRYIMPPNGRVTVVSTTENANSWANDADAIAFVKAKAAEGSVLHEKAIAYCMRWSFENARKKR